MKKRALHKSNWREIGQSKTRFLSILGIIFLGVAFFIGLSSTGPDMLETADQYFKTKHLADSNVTSTMGMTTSDLDSIKDNPKVKTAQANYYKDINLSAKNQVVRFFGYEQKQVLNHYEVVSGRLPQKKTEIALDQLAYERNYYQIGDTFTISSQDDNNLKEHSYRVVGFVNSPHYIENTSRGNTKVGKGSIDYFAVINQANFPQTIFPEVLVSYHDLTHVTAYTDTYDRRVKADQDALVKETANDPKKRVAAIKAAGEKRIKNTEEKLKQAEAAQQKALDKARQEGTKALNDAKKRLDQAKSELAAGQAEYQEKNDAAQKQVDDRQRYLDEQKQKVTEKQQAKTQKQNELTNKNQTQTHLTQQQQQQTTIENHLKNAQQVHDGLQTLADSTKDSQQLDQNQINSALASLQTPLNDQNLNELKNGVSQLDQNDPQAFNQQLAELVTKAQQQVQQFQQQQQTINQQVAATQKSLDSANNAQSQIDQLNQEIDQLNQTITTGTQQLDTAKADLTKSQQDAQTQLKSAQEKIDQAQQAYDDGQKNLEQQTKVENPVDSAGIKAKIAQQRAALKQLKPGRYIYQTRKENPGYTEYEDNAKRVSSLATVFPVIFFLIAALITFTTMARMVEEKRGEIGTLKALGYKNGEIAQKYLLYASLAGGIGTLLGLLVGTYGLPRIIFNAYGQLYNLPNFVTDWHWVYVAIAVLVALICSVGAALLVLRFDLRSAPAALMRTKAPRAGKRILLERIGPLWRHLSFMQKVTLRNLFRYKARMLMTILGIAGCMSMLITGFGLRDSISDIVTIQFNKIRHYQATTTFKQELNEKQATAYEKQLRTLPGFKEHLPLAALNFTVEKPGHNDQEVSVYAPEDARNFKDFVLLNDRKTGQEYRLSSQGVAVSEKLAELFDLKRGDKLPLKDAQGLVHQVVIEEVVENYVGHFVYMNAAYYQDVFGSEPRYNADLLLFDRQPSSKAEGQMADQLMKNPNVINVSFLSKSKNALADTIKSLNVIIWVLIIAAGLLAFIVLYNLTNINVSERIRELSTIKVLGFYDSEVVAYVYRENILLTLIGIILGLFLGKLEHRYVLNTVEVDLTMFSPEIHLKSYLYASLITLLFAAIVGVIMYFKLKKINMIEALKEND